MKRKPSLHPAKYRMVKWMRKKDLPRLTYDFKYLHTELHEWGIRAVYKNKSHW